MATLPPTLRKGPKDPNQPAPDYGFRGGTVPMGQQPQQPFVENPQPSVPITAPAPQASQPFMGGTQPAPVAPAQGAQLQPQPPPMVAPPPGPVAPPQHAVTERWRNARLTGQTPSQYTQAQAPVRSPQQTAQRRVLNQRGPNGAY